jgi:hypothetical protein
MRMVSISQAERIRSERVSEGRIRAAAKGKLYRTRKRPGMRLPAAAAAQNEHTA